MRRDHHPVGDVASEAVGSLVPGTGPLIGKAFSALHQEWQRNTSRALQAAEAVSGRSREDLQELFERDAALMPLYLRVLWAAGMNGHDETLRAMGATLGIAVGASDRDDAVESIADADQALAAMDSLTPRHFRVLRYLCEARKPASDGQPSRWNAADVAAELRLTEDRITWCLAGLEVAGLIQSNGTFFGAVHFRATSLGEAVVVAADTTTTL